MDDVKGWFEAAWEHLKEHWTEHVAPLAIFFGVTMALILGLMGTLAFAILAGALLESPLAAVLLGLCVGAPLMVLGMVVVQPLMLAYHRVVLRAIRGERSDLSIIRDTYRRALPIVLMNVAIQALTFAAMIFCFFPVFLVAIATAFAAWAMADREVGPVAALKISFDIVRRRPVEVGLSMVGMWVVMMVLAYIPLVGPLVGVMAWTTVLGVVYEALRPEVPEELWEGAQPW